MQLKILGSSSHGNCYLLIGDSETLIIEAGIPFSEVQKELNFKIDNIVGVLVTHHHGDHSKYVSQFQKSGINSYMTFETKNRLSLESHRTIEINSFEQFSVGEYKVLAYPTQHDCNGSVGFYIYHKEIGFLLFATDTYYLKYKFANLNHILIECNYSLEILNKNVENGKINKYLAKRIKKSHFELNNVKQCLLENNIDNVKNIILIHLSDKNSNAELFRQEIENATFKNTYIAEKGLKLNL